MATWLEREVRDALFRLEQRSPTHTEIDLQSEVAELQELVGGENWDLVPEPLRTSHSLPLHRTKRKNIQLLFIAAAFRKVLEANPSRRLTVVDFCAGAGHLGLFLAWLYPHHHFILVDRNPRNSLSSLHRRDASGLTNVQSINRDVTDVLLWDLDYDVAVALHACGWLSDWVMLHSARRKAHMVVCPCCWGQLYRRPAAVSKRLLYPRSRLLQKSMTESRYLSLASSADTDVEKSVMPKDNRRYLSRESILRDRCLALKESGYKEVLVARLPSSSTPQNLVIVGTT